MYIEASRLRYTSNYKKVLLVTGESESWAEYLAATLAKRFGDKIQISTVFFAKKSDHDVNADFIISTIPLDLGSTLLYVLILSLQNAITPIYSII